jgi:uncharacterized membrane protein YkoI
MKMLSKFSLAMLFMLWFGAADTRPAAAFNANSVKSGDSAGPIIQPTKNKNWAQFFEQNRGRAKKNKRRQQRNEYVIPLRTNPDQRQLRKREWPRQDRNRKQRQEQDAAREAVRRGDILPLSGIIRSAQSHCPGKFLGAKLQRGGGGYSYRVRILRPSGRRVGLTVNAKTGDVVGGRCR